ncbi:CPBP family intramembrane glutamic endopeptidase [Virgibacillus salexigens]|uniref:CPBP family intramembrane glutamic endopeptidase n=1 Tax=Virgibacillus salexigens TaxID=61016 RepID=UPI00190DE82C|nr:CPBP family intramembrane glutamic endopeptidase [Virgibacillus salexigens]
MKQSEQIKHMEDHEIRTQLIISQFVLIFISLAGSFILFDSFFRDWLRLFAWDNQDILYYGVLPGLIIVGVDLLLIRFLPPSYYDDGGINDRLFRNQSVTFIILISLMVAFAEEILFRGVLQTSFGYLIASFIFALVHLRYLRKPVLLIGVLLISFYIGYLFHLTENLVVTIVAHFIVDCLLGLVIRLKSEVGKNESTG